MELTEGVLLPYLKAVVGFVAPGAVVLGAAVTAASDGGTAITGAEWVTAVVACVLTAAGVWAAPNAVTRRSAAKLVDKMDGAQLERVLHEYRRRQGRL